MTDGPLTDDEREEIANRLFDWFWCFQRSGFDPEQALALCKTMLRDTL